MNNIVSIKWLLARLYEPDLVIIDSRFALAEPDAGRLSYEEGHIPRAVYLDLDKELSSPVSAHGGRHPLPDPQKMAEVFGKAGIGKDRRVVVYDDHGGIFASRVWWMLKYTGHPHVYVMDEGFSAWKKAGFPVTAEKPVVIPATYEPELQPDMLADVEAVRDASVTGSAVIIDSRDARRYAGFEETMDPVAGHIPGAVNYFWKELLDDQGRWRSAEEIEKRFASLPKDAEIIVYCGSGVSACPNALALHDAGYGKVRLYSGSWSDWISYPENPVATGEE